MLPSQGKIRWEMLAVFLPIAALLTNFSYTDLSDATHIRDQSAEILLSLEPNALVLARWGDEAPFTYLQIVENLRTDVQIIDRFLITRENERLLIEGNLNHRPVYVFGPLPALSFQYDTLPVEGGRDVGHRLVPPAGLSPGQHE